MAYYLRFIFAHGYVSNRSAPSILRTKESTGVEIARMAKRVLHFDISPHTANHDPIRWRILYVYALLLDEIPIQSYL